MSLYVDTSALLKRYVDEPESSSCEELLLADPTWITGRHTLVETRRNLSRLLRDRPLAIAREYFERDWARMHIVALDTRTCELAATIAETLGARSLDALHLAAATRVGASGVVFLTYDLRQAQAARALGMLVKGL